MFFFTFSQNLQEKICAGVSFLTKMRLVSYISYNPLVPEDMDWVKLRLYVHEFQLSGSGLNPDSIVQILSLPKIQQATIREFSSKTLAEESTNFFSKSFFNRAILGTYFDFLKSVIFCLNDAFIISFLNIESWILNLQATIREFSWKNPTDEVADFSVKNT